MIYVSSISLRIWILIVFLFTSVCRENTTVSISGLHAKVLKCEYRINPLGIDVEQPRLRWELESNDSIT